MSIVLNRINSKYDISSSTLSAIKKIYFLN